MATGTRGRTMAPWSVALVMSLLGCSLGWLSGVTAQQAPDFPNLAVALNRLRLTSYAAYMSTVANFSSLLTDPTTNVIMFAASNENVTSAIVEFKAQRMITDTVTARAAAMFLLIPQPAGVVGGTLNLTDGLELDTMLTTSPEYSDTRNVTLTTLTFRDNGDGRWYLGGSPPGALLTLNNTYTAGNARLYVVDGLTIPPSQANVAKDSPARVLSVAEAILATPELSTYASLAQADRMVWRMFRDGNNTAITVFAGSNTAWTTYLLQWKLNLSDFAGTPAAHDLLLAGIVVNRPYMIQQFPAGETEARDYLGRTFTLTSDGSPIPDNNLVSLVSATNPAGVYILPAPLRNIRGGKSIIHATDVVLLPDNSTLNKSPSPPPEPTPAPVGGPIPSPAGQPVAVNPGTGTASPSTTSSSSSSSSSSGGGSSTNVGLIVGLTVGLTAGVALSALVAAYLLRKRKLARELPLSSKEGGGKGLSGASPEHTRLAVGVDGRVMISSPPPGVMGAHMEISGVHKGMFTRMVAYEYSWTDVVPTPDTHVAVEAGVNDRELDALCSKADAAQGVAGGDSAAAAPMTRDCPVVKLSKEEVKEKVHLLRHGILGKGATAMVFQCVWPERFGPNALLAIKVLKEGSDADPQHLSSFVYETSVLKSLLHPNIVRLYGYCLEPPCVCIILELLPVSLKQLMYDIEPTATAMMSTPSGTGELRIASTGVGSHGGGRISSHGGQGSNHLNNSNHLPSGSGSLPTTGLAAPQSGHSTAVNKVASTTEVTVHYEHGTDNALTAVRKLNMQQVLSISNDIAAGLAHMHNSSREEVEAQSPFMEPAPPPVGMKVVHRDLKPANILLNSRGQAKISDFGLARKHHQTTIGTAHLGAGTLPYMAPELLVHASAGGYATASATNRVDIYSLAMIMWEMLAGHTPWQGSADAALVIAVTQGRRPLLPEPPAIEPPLDPAVLYTEAGLGTLPQFNTIIRACWRQRELKRPTAVAVHHELCRLLGALGMSVTTQITLPINESSMDLRMSLGTELSSSVNAFAPPPGPAE